VAKTLARSERRVITQRSKNVFEVVYRSKFNANLEEWILLSGDRHWDNPKSDHEKQLEHLEEAKRRNALIVDIGDFFCVMQGKYDKRASKAAVRPEHQVDDYLDSVINTAGKFFKPYAKQFLCIGFGNHESAISKRHETHLTERLIGVLNNGTGAHVYNGGFAGWVLFRFPHDSGGSRESYSVKLHYDHGYGGGGQVTHDAIQHQRRAVTYPDADIIISGHTHDAWVKEFGRQRCGRLGNIFQDIQTHIKLPTYKDDYGDGSSGWHAETGKPPKPLGAWWLKFTWDRKLRKIVYDVIRAR